jgi:hypothetical protein
MGHTIKTQEPLLQLQQPKLQDNLYQPLEPF